MGLSTGQAAQSPIQPGLEHCQGWGTHSFPVQPVPEPRHPRQSKVTEPVEPRKTKSHACSPATSLGCLRNGGHLMNQRMHPFIDA